MKAKMLKIAGVKSEKEFYKKFPDEESFMKAHGKEFKKAMRGTKVEKAQPGVTIFRSQFPDDASYQAAVAQWYAGQQGGGVQLGVPFLPANQMGVNYAYPPYARSNQPSSEARPTTQTAPLPRTQLGNVKDTGTRPTPSATPSATKQKGFNAMPYMEAAGDIIQGAKMLKEERDALREARQMNQLVDVQALASASRPKQQPKRQYVRPEDVIPQPEQMFPSYGVGTNVLAQDGAVIRDNIGGNPTEIMNVYNPGDMYTDLGYEPLNDTSKLKQYLAGGKLTVAQNGFGNQNWMQDTQFGDIMGRQGGAQFAGNLSETITGGPSGGSKIGGGIGKAAGTAFGGPIGGMVGEAAGKLIGGALDQKQKKIEAAQKRTAIGIGNIAGQATAMNLQSQFSGNVQNGDDISPYKWVSHTWQPQVIAQFNGHNVKDLLRAPKDADMLRAGGHLKEYTPPSAQAMQTDNFQMGGELQTHWGGYAEPLSQNPYLPDGGETVMFRGQSHDESDGRGNTGIGITYGDNPVEVERGEPAVRLQDGGDGDTNLTVFGNIKITNAFADMLGDIKAKGKKFKHYVKDLSKQENKQNKLIDKSIEAIDNLKVHSSFDQLKLGTLQANLIGGNAKLKDLAEKKINAAALQNAINDTKEEEGLVDITDQGDVKAEKGASIPKAQTGTTRGRRARAELANVDPKIKGLFDLLASKNYDVYATSGYRGGATTAQGNPSRHAAGEAMDMQFPSLTDQAYETILNDADVAKYMLQNGITAINEYDAATQKATGATGPHIHFGFDKGTPTADKFRNEANAKYPDALTTNVGLPKVSPENFKYLRDLYYNAQKEGRGPAVLKFQQEFHRLAPEYAKSVLSKYPTTAYGKKQGLTASDLNQNLDSIFGKRTQQYMSELNSGMGDVPVGDMANIQTLTEAILPPGKKKVTKKDMAELTVNPLKRNMLFDAFNTILPYLRPSDVEKLDPMQLLGETYALSQNQVEPVYAQKFTPELGTPYDISLQDILNQNQADYNSTQRLTGYNPAALASLNAQKYAANQKVLGEQFRLNQAEKDKVYSENRNLLNQSKLQNLQILDRQAEKQAKALSQTKATTQAALNSIASKYAQNKLENRTLAVMENMYNYRFDPKFRAINMNPLAQWDTTAGSKSSGIPEAPEGYEYETILKKKKKDSESSRNGSIVRNLKNI